MLSVQVQATSLPGEIAQSMRISDLDPENVAIYIREVSKKTPLLSWQSRKPMSPASTMKLVTTYASLSLLGQAYKWKTEAYTSGKMANGVLDGQLILKGYGDPKLDIERLWLFVNDLRARGLKDIRGGLLFDRSYFGAQGNPGSFDGKRYRPYTVVPDALLANFEANSIRFVPEGHSVKLILLPAFSSLSVSNGIRPVAGPCRDWQDGILEEVASDGKSARLSLSGTYPDSCGEKFDDIAAYDHSEYLFQLFARLWRESGGKIEGTWHEGKLPEDAKLFSTTYSPPLSSLVVDMNKYSNNVMARQIFLTLGTLKSTPGTEEAARSVVKSWLASRHLDFPELYMENGSGLSRQARISAGHMGELLIDAFESPLMPVFYSSLPVAGIDGTMKKRLKDSIVTGRAYIKTGSLENVRAIAGVIQAKSGKRYVIVCIINDPKAATSKPFEDRLLLWLDEHG
jgi:D-alanyl-D-alanine carboxypeptidase/D-alanyl-D-alanine-endopeptidase (penicillin-binding protein 4)